MKRLLLVFTLAALTVGAEPPKFATGAKGMVAAATPSAARAGVRMLEAGGNAVDAAVAAAFAEMVADPPMASLGGRCHILMALASGEIVRIDGATQAPANIPPLVHEKERRSGFAVVPVPGNPAALIKASKNHGRLDLATVMAPAIELAENGFPVSETVASVWKATEGELRKSTSAAPYYLKSGREAYRTGETFRHPILAKALRRFANEGSDGFYRGAFGQAIVGHVRAEGGHLQEGDLRNYRAPDAGIVRSKYRGLEVVSAGVRAWGNTMVEMLNIQDHFSISPGEPRAEEVLVQTLVIAQALEDRPQGLGTLEDKKDGIPLEKLSSPEFALERAALIRQKLRRANIAGKPDGPPKPHDTTHISAMDAEGNVVALTTSIGPAFGARVLTPEFGFLYAHSYRMRSHPVPGARDDTEMTPTIVFQSGQPVLVIGAAGAQRIPSAIFQVIANLVDRGYTLSRAVTAPRIYPAGGKVWLESGFPESVPNLLRSRGFEVAFDPKSFHMGRIHAITFDPSTRQFAGAADTRYDGVVLSPR